MTYKFPCQVLVTMKTVIQVARSKTCTAFYRSNAGIVGANPTRSSDMCAFFVLSYVSSDVAQDRTSVQTGIPNVYKNTKKLGKKGGPSLYWNAVS